MTYPLAVTVSSSAGLVADAKAAAARWQLPYFERRKNTGLQSAMGRFADAFLVLGHDGWALHDAHGVLRWSPGMAALRIKRINSGYPLDDVLVKLAEVRRGDVVVDATLGLGADALVCAHLVGPTGRVLAIEASLPLYALVSEGLRQAKQPIEVQHGDSFEVLRKLPTAWADCVVFDPMFELPKRASPAFEMLRRYADHRPLDIACLNEARRVARRWVVVKAGRHTNEFQRLGLTAAQTSRYKPTIWARVQSTNQPVV